MNVLFDYDFMVKDVFIRVVKMNFKLVEVWNCFGECYWKNGEVEVVRNCFVGVLNYVSECLYRLFKENFGKFNLLELCNVKLNYYVSFLLLFYVFFSFKKGIVYNFCCEVRSRYFC